MGQLVLAAAIAILTSTAAFPQTDTWQARMDEGNAALTLGNYAAAASTYRSATEIAGQFELRDKRRAVAWNALATVYDTLGRFAEAETAYRRALKEAAASTGKGGPEYAMALMNLGASYVQTGQTIAGERLVRESLAIYSAADPPDEFRIAAAQNALAEVLCLIGRYTEAPALLTRALAVFEKIPGAWGETALALNSLGAVRFLEGNREEGRLLLLRGLALMEQHLGPDHPMVTRILNNLASVEYRTGHREEAGQYLRRALDIAKQRLGPEHPSYALLLANYAAYLRQGGDKAGARVLEAQSTRILKNVTRQNGLGSVVDVSALRAK